VFELIRVDSAKITRVTDRRLTSHSIFRFLCLIAASVQPRKVKSGCSGIVELLARCSFGKIHSFPTGCAF